MTSVTTELVVGQIIRPHGVRGEVLVAVRTDEPEQRFTAGAVLLASPQSAGTRSVGGRPAGQLPAGSGASGSGAPGSSLPGQRSGGRQPAVDPALTALLRGGLTIESSRPHQGRLIVAFDGVLDRNAAELLRGVLLRVPLAELPPIEDPDDFRDQDLLGLSMVDIDGQVLGEVVRVDHAPANDLLVTRLGDGRTVLVPFVKAIVPEVDIAGRRVVVTPPGGLFDL